MQLKFAVFISLAAVAYVGAEKRWSDDQIDFYHKNIACSYNETIIQRENECMKYTPEETMEMFLECARSAVPPEISSDQAKWKDYFCENDQKLRDATDCSMDPDPLERVTSEEDKELLKQWQECLDKLLFETIGTPQED